MKRTLAGLAPVLLVFAVIGCAAATVSDKKMVDVAYKGTLTDGTVFSKSADGKPLEFLVGGGTIIPTLEKGMMGMKVGDKKIITVKAADAYGEYDKESVREIAREQFPKDVELKIGERYQVNGPGGPMVVSITAMTAMTVTIDFNHPLAGKDLTFEVTIVKIRDATKDELAKAAPQASPQTAPQGQTTQQ
jgi:FKBP-type peptidyl-prolyl cis-trans isomerase 2